MTYYEQYEPPVVTHYGTVADLTLGNGNTTTADAAQCTGYGLTGFQSNTPSLLTCKTSS
ncbi:MAG TPA: lasso RiPP family leader peptide-containing protein [Gaiellaceae bacterium]|nr:lasso RiPP family leader peptide-containing protein [Gaiellaceae bacterium]